MIDVRDAAAYERAHLPGAVSMPLDKIAEHVAELRSAGKPIVTYCGGPVGEKGARAAQTLLSLGVTDVRALAGGFQRWVEAGYVVETPPTFGE